MNMHIIGIDLAASAKHKAMIFDPASYEFIGGQIVCRAWPADLERLLQRARKEAPVDVYLRAILETHRQ